MNDISTRLKKGIAAVQTGALTEGERLLRQVVKADPANEQAWYWLSAAVDDLEERKACLRRVLEINMHNEAAWRALQALVITPPKVSTERSEPDEVLTSAGGFEFSCPGCQADLEFSPGRQALVCPSCGRVTEITGEERRPECLPLARMPATREAQEEWVGKQIYRCQDCGATTTISSRRGSLECPFCGSTYVVKPPTAVALINPQAILPFQLDAAEAEAALRRWLDEGSLLRPGKLSAEAEIARLHGVYIPFWLFDGLANIHRRDEEGNRMVSQRLVKDMPLCGSLSLPAKMLKGIEPFDLQRLRPFQPAYMAGWAAQVYQISLADASVQVRAPIRRQAELAYSNVEQVNFTDEGWLLALLPIFLGAYHYAGHLYLFAVNGQTGRVHATMPRSNWRVALLIAFGLLLMILIVLLIALMGRQVGLVPSR